MSQRFIPRLSIFIVLSCGILQALTQQHTIYSVEWESHYTTLKE